MPCNRVRIDHLSESNKGQYSPWSRMTRFPKRPLGQTYQANLLIVHFIEKWATEEPVYREFIRDSLMTLVCFGAMGLSNVRMNEPKFIARIHLRWVHIMESLRRSVGSVPGPCLEIKIFHNRNWTVDRAGRMMPCGRGRVRMDRSWESDEWTVFAKIQNDTVPE
jgi:hypothetical protein